MVAGFVPSDSTNIELNNYMNIELRVRTTQTETRTKIYLFKKCLT